MQALLVRALLAWTFLLPVLSSAQLHRGYVTTFGNPSGLPSV